MRIVRDPAELAVTERPVGFVPTMGAFHEGHLELMRASARENARTVVSLFVNPTQFAPHEDLSKYPRNEARDAELAEAAGADVLFAPSVDTIYPRHTTEVRVSGVSERFEGAIRPTHFAGVATVVLKLFNMVRPDRAYFGLKDLQQCAVVKRMVEDLNVPVELRFLETVREQDGLAMSSRNVYLSPDERERAPRLHDVLVQLARSLREDPSVLAEELVPAATAALNRHGFEVQYLALVDPESMEPRSKFHSSFRWIVAARLGNIRLIDNVPA
ncbi:MAG: pantothenate synthetase [Chthonomonas sp.]